LRNFNLTTWSGERLVAYEPITAASPEEAVAFVQGMLAERTKGETDFLAKMGIRYVIDHGHRALQELPIGAKPGIGSWHLAEDIGGPTLLWQPNEADLKAR